MKIIQPGINCIFLIPYRHKMVKVIFIMIKITKLLQSGFISITPKNWTNRIVKIISKLIKIQRIPNNLFFIDIISN